MKHPGEIELALFAGGDLGFVERWRVARHVRRCEQCRSEVDALRHGTDLLRDLADEMPKSVNWSRLSQEMTGNIRVGLAAGECVGPIPTTRPRSLAWHAVAITGVAFVIGIGAMWLNMPQQADHLVSSLRAIRWNRVGTLVRVPAVQDAIILEASQSSIDLKSSGGTMSFIIPRAVGDSATSRNESVAVSVSMQGSAGAQYVDSDTGQVTINRVYYAQ